MILLLIVVLLLTPIGTDPETLIEQAKAGIDRILEGDIVVFETIFDGETGAYDED